MDAVQPELSQQIILSTERLYVRQWQPGDYDPALRLLSDERVTRYLPPAPCSHADIRSMLDWVIEHPLPALPRFFCLPVVLKDGDEMIGRVGINPLWSCDEPDTCEPEMEWLLMPEYWRRGLGTEIAKGLIRYGFEQSDFEILFAFAHPENIASLRVMQKAGMRYCRSDLIRGDECIFYCIYK